MLELFRTIQIYNNMKPTVTFGLADILLTIVVTVIVLILNFSGIWWIKETFEKDNSIKSITGVTAFIVMTVAILFNHIYFFEFIPRLIR